MHVSGTAFYISVEELRNLTPEGRVALHAEQRQRLNVVPLLSALAALTDQHVTPSQEAKTNAGNAVAIEALMNVAEPIARSSRALTAALSGDLQRARAIVEKRK